MQDKVTMNNLKKLIKAQNKTLTNLAVELEVSQEAISQYISGKINPKLSTIVKIAKILNTSTDYLLDLTDNPAPSEYVLDEDEFLLIHNYRRLPKTNKDKLSSYVEAMSDLINDGELPKLKSR